MIAHSAFDLSKPFDIMAGHWVATASIYNPAGTYLLSTKSYVSVFWNSDGTLSFRESAEDDMEFKGRSQDYVDPRTDDGIKRIASLLAGALGKNFTVPKSTTLRHLQYDFAVNGSHCETTTNDPVSVNGRQTRPDAYQFHVKKKKTRKDGTVYYHHVYNSHHMPSPDDWHIIGPIVGPVQNVDGQIGLSVIQFLRRISYHVPETAVKGIG